MEKHVIFLGAGASKTSGYPLADELRLLIASPAFLHRRFREQTGDLYEEFKPKLDDWMNGLRRPIQLFREGGFATVDEFIRLTGSLYEPEQNALTRLLSLCLAIHNPEQEFENSDYYRFIQRLFQRDLLNLRDDVSVLSYNYDPYLEFLLRRAYVTRCEAVGEKPSPRVEDAILSGFESRGIHAWQGVDDFCLLKLHGTIALPKRGRRGPDCLTHDDLFAPDPSTRFRAALSTRFTGAGFSPVYFPWEVIGPGGEFARRNDFRFANDAEQKRGVGGYEGEIGLHELFEAIWKRARKEVQQATKISFVGISLHNYLRSGLKFLFAGKQGNVELVVADKSLDKFKDYEDSAVHFDALSPIARLDQMLREYCPKLRWNVLESNSSLGAIETLGLDADSRRPIRIRKSFEEFILKDL
jgi:hypothetical protein